MLIRYFILLSIILNNIQPAKAQSFEKDYQPLKSVGELPEEYILPVKERIDIELARQNNRSHTKTLNKKLIIDSNFDLEELFQSGYILLNDTISVYVNSVANEIIKQVPGLSGKLSIYVIKSPEVNACCFENGTIFVNIGLIAKLENEAQLASILCHEFIHYIKQHSLKRIIEFDKIKRNKPGKRKFEDKVLMMYQYSKENETEADTAGLNIYVKTNYQVNQAAKALSILKYADTPFEEFKFEKTFFEDEYYKLPKDYFLNEFSAVSLRESADDTYLTHPNINSRISLVDSLQKSQSVINEKKEFIISESAFQYIREISRFECCKMFLIERNYIDAFKWSYLLKQKYPNNLFVNKILAKSLYALTLYKVGKLKYSDESYHNNAIGDYNKIEGPAQQVNYFFSKIPDKELGILTLRFIWQNSFKYKEDKLLLSYCDSVGTLLFTKFYFNPSEFQTTFNPDSISANYYSTAFIDCFKNETFSKMFFKNSNKTENLKFTSSSGLNKFEFSTTKKPEKNISKPINIKKLFLIKPSYNYTVEDQDDVKHLFVSNEKENKLYATTQRLLKSNGIHFKTLDLDKITASDIDKYNNLSEVNCWLDERVDAGIVNNNPLFGTDSLKILSSFNDINCGLLISVDSKKIKEDVGEKLLILYGWGWLIFPIPIVIYQINNPEKQTVISISLINLKSGDVMKTKSYTGNYRNVDKYLNRYINRFILEIK